MSTVTLINPPVVSLERPSLGLGLLHARLVDTNIDTQTIHANIAFSQQIGLVSHAILNMAYHKSLLGEWAFAQSVFGDRAGGLQDAQIRTAFAGAHSSTLTQLLMIEGDDSLPDFLKRIRAEASRFASRIAQEIVDQHPRIVGCTSMFQQHTAALGILKEVKALSPDTITMIGGANCAEEMGHATHRTFEWVDYTIIGEIDDDIVSFCSGLLDHHTDSRQQALPANVLGPRHRDPQQTIAQPPRTVMEDMNSSPIPNFDSYFQALENTPIGRYIQPIIQLETSRGCWWGQKHHCTFCGLDALGMVYRKKSPERALSEIRELTTKYRVSRWSATDDIIDMTYFTSVLPKLEEDETDYAFFFETKANLKPEHVRTLAKSGGRVIQPGIESLHDQTLRLMKKGTTACINIYLLKNCLEQGVLPLWTILCGLPESDPDWVHQVAQRFPALSHLPPPFSATLIRFDRFSPYFTNSQALGLKLKPTLAYSDIYPVDDDTLSRLAYFFEDQDRTAWVHDTARMARAEVDRWRECFWSKKRANLTIEEDTGDRIVVVDSRPCAEASRHVLQGTDAKLLKALSSPVSLDGVGRRLTRMDEHAHDDALDQALTRLSERKLIWKSETQLIALPTAQPVRPMPRAEEFLGGTDLTRYLRDVANFREMFA